MTPRNPGANVANDTWVNDIEETFPHKTRHLLPFFADPLIRRFNHSFHFLSVDHLFEIMSAPRHARMMQVCKKRKADDQVKQEEDNYSHADDQVKKEEDNDSEADDQDKDQVKDEEGSEDEDEDEESDDDALSLSEAVNDDDELKKVFEEAERFSNTNDEADFDKFDKKNKAAMHDAMQARGGDSLSGCQVRRMIWVLVASQEMAKRLRPSPSSSSSAAAAAADVPSAADAAAYVPPDSGSQQY